MNNENTNKDQSRSEVRTRRGYLPKFALFHPNAKCTGCAIKMEMHPARHDSDGYIMAIFANQMTVGERVGDKITYSTFDWENMVCVKLDFNDLTKMLEVLRGLKPSLEDGRGLFHLSASGTTKITLHKVEQSDAYALEVYRNKPSNPNPTSARIILKSSEAYGIALAIEDSLGAICFGVPYGADAANL